MSNKMPLSVGSRRRSRRAPAAPPGPSEPQVLLGILPELIGYHVRLAQIAIFEDFGRTLAALALSPGLFALLAIIGANPGMKQARLAEAARLDRSTLVPALDKLEARRLVERRPDPQDRRSNGLFLTMAGRELLARAESAVRAHEANLARGLSPEERRLLIGLLERLTPKEDTGPWLA